METASEDIGRYTKHLTLAALQSVVHMKEDAIVVVGSRLKDGIMFPFLGSSLPEISWCYLKRWAAIQQ
eukprot:c30867_g1_i1 orf=1-204(+)